MEVFLYKALHNKLQCGVSKLCEMQQTYRGHTNLVLTAQIGTLLQKYLKAYPVTFQAPCLNLPKFCSWIVRLRLGILKHLYQLLKVKHYFKKNFHFIIDSSQEILLPPPYFTARLKPHHLDHKTLSISINVIDKVET